MKSPDIPAVVKYTKIVADTQEEKLLSKNLNEFQSLMRSIGNCAQDDWHSPFLPMGNSEYFNWPRVDHIFPWNVPGIKFHRTWPIAESKELLEDRWIRFCSSSQNQRSKLLKETSDRKMIPK